MKTLRYKPFRIDFREDQDGQWRFTATVNNKVLFHDIPYHELQMAIILVDAVVDQELGTQSDDRPIDG